jgi:ParB family chromosome partitioning protein
MERRSLGKGLSALIPERADVVKSDIVTYIKTEILKGNAFQPRTHYDEASLEDLKASIREKGVLQPILVRAKAGEYEVIAGERRLKAARALNMPEVPVIIKDVTDQEALVLALVENIQREDLNPIEEAEAYRRLIEEFRYTHDQVAESVGKDRSTVSNLLRLLKLPAEIQKSVYEGALSVGHARALLSVEISSEQNRLFSLVMRKGLSVRDLEDLTSPASQTMSSQAKTQKPKSHEVVALEEQLQKALGTRVTIHSKHKKGKIIIEYYSLDDLDRILDIIKP